MTTLKEAYESVGETIKEGDILGDSTHTVRFTDGWYFDFLPYHERTCVVYSASRFELLSMYLPITRNGKQIFPKVEEVAPLPYSRQWNELVDFYAIKQNMDIMQAQELANLLFDYVCAIIRSKGDKCNS